ncbi:YciI family protein [Terrimonas rubra]|uniref:YciI family protein n=1 Tax=Terrimonas rubra TaxID=1035890 RepID=A0ABW6A0W9_9BACT
MKEFALIFRLKDIGDFKPSPEQMQQRMNWLAGIAAQDKLVDKGNTLLPAPGSAKTVKPNNVVTDGPYTEIKEFISGYIVIKAESIDEAVAIAKENPIFEQVGGSIEVREILKRD